MLDGPAAGFLASAKGSVAALPGPCCRRELVGRSPGRWRNEHGRGPGAAGGKHWVQAFSGLRAGRSVTEVAWLGSVLREHVVCRHAAAVATQGSASTLPGIMLSAWDPRNGPPVLVEPGTFEEAGVADVSGSSDNEGGGGVGSPRDGGGGVGSLTDARSVKAGRAGDMDHGVSGKKKKVPGKVHPNKGKMPWNKGRRHSPETIALIRKRTMEAMGDPKIREKLRTFACNQRCSDETKAKIKASIAASWGAKRIVKKAQDACVAAWRESVAEGARMGLVGDGELQWDSYKLIKAEMLAEEKARAKEFRKEKSLKEKRRSKRVVAVAGSHEHRQKISEAIRAKWSDPEYRQRVQDGLQKFVNSKTSSPKTSNSQRSRGPVHSSVPKEYSKATPRASSPPRKPVQKQELVEEPPKHITFIDPYASEKLEKIRRIQAGRRMMELRKREAAERARLLMAEAEKAAMALEAVAATDEATRLSLAETRRLLAEAADKIRTAEARR